MMALRAGHGTGAGVPRIEVLPADELPAASPANTDRPDRGPDGRFLPGNGLARSQKTRPSRYGSLVLALAKADRVYQTCARWGTRYASHRRAELAKAHGGELSAGVGALVESAGNALADSRYVRAKAAERGEVALFKLAASLATEARQCELAAWELASREAAARPRGRFDPLAKWRRPTDGQLTAPTPPKETAK